MSLALETAAAEYRAIEAKIRLGGGRGAIERQHEKGRLTARERIAGLVDAAGGGRGAGAAGSADPHEADIPNFQELGLWAAYGMYAEHGGAPGAGVVTGIGVIHGRRHMIIANDATVKAGAFFPMTCKKIIRAQHIARMARLPLVYLVDSAGVFLPLQEDVFPDTDDFGRIFYLNSVISAEGIAQTAAIMGFCVAGGGYLPVLCDTLLMTEGSGLYLAGPALVKAAIGQSVSDEELGGAAMHAAISGTIDFKEKDDVSCLRRLREVLGKRGDERTGEGAREGGRCGSCRGSARDATDAVTLFKDKPGEQYDVRQIIACLVDCRGEPNGDGHESLAPDFDEYKADYGASLVCGYARVGGFACGIVANQGCLTQQAEAGGKAGPHTSTNMPRVIYDESADKAARFIMDCNQRKIPLIFLHDTTGFMVGRDSEQAGIIRSGAKMVNAMSNSIVPKIVLIMGGSYGAGNYAMCGRAFEPFLTLAWPGARCAVMGAAQASGVLAMIEEKSRERKGETIDPATHKAILDAVRAGYSEQADIRHGAARGWLDRVIDPRATRAELIEALAAAEQGWDYGRTFRTGVLQV
jgi:acetyl-CoA carboxylase carboxyltransferase component